MDLVTISEQLTLIADLIQCVGGSIVGVLLALIVTRGLKL